jgi:hypothetical protein
MDNPISVEKVDDYWLHVAFHLPHFLQLGWRWMLPSGKIAVSFHGCTHKSNFHQQLQPWKESLGNFWPAMSAALAWILQQSASCRADLTGWHTPYDSPTMWQKSWIVHLWSSQIPSHMFAIFSSAMLIEGHSEHSANFKQVSGVRLTQSVITKCLFKH